MAQLIKANTAYGVNQPTTQVMPLVQYINGAPNASTQGVLGQQVIDQNTLVAYILVGVDAGGAIWSTINEDGVQTINNVLPVDGNIEFTSTGASIAFTNPSPGVINAEAIGGGGGIGSINGDVSSVSGAVVTFTGGSSGAVFTGDGVTTMTQSFDFLDLPLTTAGGNGAIYIGGVRFAHTYGDPSGVNTWLGTGAGNFGNASTDNVGIGAGACSGIGDGSRNVVVGWNAGTGMGVSSSDNIFIGSNVIGQAGDDSTIRIGNPGGGMNGQDVCYIAGIWGESGNLDAVQSVVLMDQNSLIAAMPVATDGQLVIGATGAPLAWGNITSLGGSITVSNTANSIDLSVAGGSPITAIDGDSGSATGSTITFTGGTSGAVFTAAGSTVTESFDFLALPATTGSSLGVITIGGSPFLHAYGADSDNNTFVGFNAGNFTLTSGTAKLNVAFGADSMLSLTTGELNTGIGTQSGQMISSGSENTLIGADSCLELVNGSFNVALGRSSMLSLASGSSNIALGYQAGLSYAGAESSNILVGSPGVLGESNSIRIGVQGAGSGQQNTCSIAGIISTAATATSEIVLVDSTGEMGSAGAATDGQILIGATGAAPVLANISAGTGISITNAANSITIAATGTTTLAYTNVAATPYVVLTTDEFISVDSSGGAITVELPNAATLGRAFIIKDRTGSAGANAITVTTVGGVVNIDAAPTFVMNTAYQSVQVIGNGTTYEIY